VKYCVLATKGIRRGRTGAIVYVFVCLDSQSMVARAEPMITGDSGNR